MILLISSFALSISILLIIIGILSDDDDVKTLGGILSVAITFIGFILLGLCVPTKTVSKTYDIEYKKTDYHTIVLYGNNNEYVSDKVMLYKNINDDYILKTKSTKNSYGIELEKEIILRSEE